MFHFVIVLVEFIVLFFLARKVTQSLSQILYTVTKSKNVTITMLSFIFLPGVVVHELAHMLVASLLFVPVGEIEFFPQLQDGGVKMGSVEIGRTDPIRRALIGVAPVLIGAGILIGGFFFLQPSLEVVTFATFFTIFPFWKLLLIVYIVFQVANTMFSSKKDVEGTVELIVVILLIAVAVRIFGVPLEDIFIQFLSRPGVESFFQAVSWILLVPLGIDAGVYGIARFLIKR